MLPPDPLIHLALERGVVRGAKELKEREKKKGQRALKQSALRSGSDAVPITC